MNVQSDKLILGSTAVWLCALLILTEVFTEGGTGVCIESIINCQKHKPEPDCYNYSVYL